MFVLPDDAGKPTISVLVIVISALSSPIKTQIRPEFVIGRIHDAIGVRGNWSYVTHSGGGSVNDEGACEDSEINASRT
jgi:hypothetical protein